MPEIIITINWPAQQINTQITCEPELDAEPLTPEEIGEGVTVMLYKLIQAKAAECNVN